MKTQMERIGRNVPGREESMIGMHFLCEVRGGIVCRLATWCCSGYIARGATNDPMIIYSKMSDQLGKQIILI